MESDPICERQSAHGHQHQFYQSLIHAEAVAHKDLVVHC